MNDRAPVVAALQMHSASPDPTENLAHAVRLCEEAALAGAQLLVLPELFAVQYAGFSRRDPALLALAEPLDGPTCQTLGAVAREHAVWILAPIYERALPGIAYDTAVLLGPDGGRRGVYRKTHVALLAQESNGQEKFYFREGNEFPVWDTPWGRVGTLICYDRNFPEAWRMLVEQGVELVLVPITTDGRSLFREVAQVMCYLNGVYGVFVNRVGQEDDRSFFGGSVVCGPRGEVLAQAGTEETILHVPLDLSQVALARANMPFLRDTRPELYGR